MIAPRANSKFFIWHGNSVAKFLYGMRRTVCPDLNYGISVVSGAGTHNSDSDNDKIH